MIARNCLRRFSVLVLIGALHGFSLAQESTSALEDGFRNPPDSAKPRVWWHWLNGNVTKEGITADLEWMKRAAGACCEQQPATTKAAIATIDPNPIRPRT